MLSMLLERWCSTQRRTRGFRSGLVSGNSDREDLADLLFCLPGADETGVDLEAVTGGERGGLSRTVLCQRHFALEEVDQLVRLVSDVICARRRLPEASQKLAVRRLVLDPGLHGR